MLVVLLPVIIAGCKKEEPNQVCDSTLDFTLKGSHTDYRSFEFSVDAMGAFESFTWDFGDGQTLQGQTVTHFFNSPGTYTVKCSGLMECGDSFTTEKTVVVSDEFEYRYIVNQIDVSVGNSSSNSEDYSASQDLSEDDGLFGLGSLRANSSASNPVAFSINYETYYYINPFIFGLTIYPTGSLSSYGFPSVGVYSNQNSPATALIQVSHTQSINGVNDLFIGNSLDSGVISVDVSRSDSVMLGDFTYTIPPSLSGSASRTGSGAFEVQRIKYYYPG